MRKGVLLVGTGRMARHYAAVLQALRVPAFALGRNEKRAKAFEQETGIVAQGGGVKSLDWAPETAIVAVDAEKLAAVAEEVLAVGVKKILLEKPGALTGSELKKLARYAQRAGARVWIAYNRRYLASVLKAQELVKKDGGITSFSFEFNERPTQKEAIKKLKAHKAVERKWFLANSTHVVDLAFFLGGWPEKLEGFSAAGPLWAPHPSLFSGGGITKKSIPFFYRANWELLGPWSVEIGTKKRKLILAPLETLREEIGGVVCPVPFRDSLDKKFKPGLYQQTKAFLAGKPDLPTVEEQIEHFAWFERMEKGR